MKKEKKNLAFLKIERGSCRKKDFSANYFADLDFIAVTRKEFTPRSHRHRSFSCPEGSASLEYISKGMVFLHMDKTRVLLKAPCVFWIIGDYAKYRFSFVEGSPEYEHFWVDFKGERAIRIREALYHFSDHCFLEPEPGRDPFGELFKELHISFHSDRQNNHSSMVILLEKILKELYNSKTSRKEEEEFDPYGIMQLAETFRNHPFDTCDLEQLARKRNLSLMHLRTLFRERVGTPPAAYLKKIRMEQACRMLESGRMRISEVAEACQYPDPAGFSRAFSRTYNCSPRQWLKKRQVMEE